MSYSLDETASLIGAPPGTLRRWLGKYIFPVGVQNDRNEWEFTDADAQVLKGMYETVQFGDRMAFVIKKQFRHLLRRRPKQKPSARPKASTPNTNTTPMRRRLQEMQKRWPEVSIHALLWVVPEKREEYVQKVREGYMTLSSAAKIVKLSEGHLRQRIAQNATRFFPKTVFFPLAGNHPSPTPLLHPDDVENFRQFYARPEGMLSIEQGAHYAGVHASTIRNGLREKTLKADAVVDGHVKLFKKETLDAFKEFVRTRARKTPKRRVGHPASKIVGWERASQLTGKSVIWLRRRAGSLGGTRVGNTWMFDRDALLAATKNDLPLGAYSPPEGDPPPPPRPDTGTPRKVTLDNGRLVYVNAYGVTEEARVVIRVRKDRGILIMVDAAGCDVDPATRKTVSEALNRDIWWSYDTDGTVIPWLSPE